jgi:hypothetical protein
MVVQATPLRLATPYQDWQSKQPIFWGTTNSPSAPQIDAATLSKIRYEAIATNFQTKEPTVVTVGLVTAHPREKLSFLSIFQSAVKGSYREGRLLKNSAQIAGIFLALIGIIVLTSIIGIAVFTRVKSDFLKLLVLAGAGLIGIAIGSSVGRVIDKLEKHDPLSLFAILKRLKQMNQGSHTLTQNIQQCLSSVGNADLAKLAISKDGNGWTDPISLELIPEDKIRAPYYFLIGRYVTHVENVLKVIFNYFDETNHRIRHPIETRFMTKEENTKCLENICALFSITETEFLNLWNDRPIIGIPNSLLTKTNDIRCLLRLFSFCKLIPEDIRKNHLKGIVRLDQIDLFARMWILSATPNKWSFDHPDGWIELPSRDNDKPTHICTLFHPRVTSNEFAFPPAILLSKTVMVQSFEEYKAELMRSELGRFSPSVDEGVLFEVINLDQTHAYHFLIFKEGTVFHLTTIAHQDDFATFSNLFKQAICSFRLGDDVTPTTHEKLAEFEQLTNQR